MKTAPHQHEGERIAVAALKQVDKLQLAPVDQVYVLAVVRDVVDAHRDRVIATNDLDDEDDDE